MPSSNSLFESDVMALCVGYRVDAGVNEFLLTGRPLSRSIFTMKNTMLSGFAVSFLTAPATYAQAPAPAPATTPAAQQPQARRIESTLAREAVEATIAACTAQNLRV